ncbi:MAG: hypothetical protein IKS14_01615, partial [Thermoguttaceae bacterium]|nr:hypothetical protein [Thermoguttaceae bacterium]
FFCVKFSQEPKLEKANFLKANIDIVPDFQGKRSRKTGFCRRMNNRYFWIIWQIFLNFLFLPNLCLLSCLFFSR